MRYTIFMDTNQTTSYNKQDNNKEFASVQAVDRALLLLQFVAESSVPISLGELTKKSNMNRTTTWRLIGTLENHGYVERDPYTKGYLLGYAATKLATQVSHYGSLVRRSRPIMEALRDETQETVSLSVPKYNSTLTVDQLDPVHSVRIANYVNEYLPLHCTSNGKVLLSFLPDDELNVFLNQPLEKMTPLTITDPKQLLEEIRNVQKQGYGSVFGELDPNENGTTVPILDHKHQLIAFLAVGGPNFRLTKERMLEIVPRLKEAAKEIGNQLI